MIYNVVYVDAAGEEHACSIFSFDTRAAIREALITHQEAVRIIHCQPQKADD
jgi:hypothetical protein|tara:strand:+ start:323 stop:478 length:156 start_codon:yes stop_codon:yes gene_type:complete